MAERTIAHVFTYRQIDSVEHELNIGIPAGGRAERRKESLGNLLTHRLETAAMGSLLLLLASSVMPVRASVIPNPDPALVCVFMFADRFEQPEAGGECDSNFDVNVPSAWIDVQVTINGDTPPLSDFEDGEIRLRNLATGDEVFVGESSTEDGLIGPIPVVTGNYDAIWSLQSGGSMVPVNTSAIVGSFVIEDDQQVNIEVPMVTVYGEFTIDGEVPADSPLSTARIYLRNESSGDELLLGEIHQGSFLRNVVPGTYDVVYERTQGFVLPANTNAIVDQVTIANAPDIVQTVDVDLVSGHVSGDIRFDGQVPPNDNEDYGRIWFIDTETGDDILVGDSRNGTYGARLLAGSYDVHYRAGEAGAVAPVNENARILAGIEVAAGGSHDVDLNIRVVDVEAAVTINSQTPPASVLEFGNIIVRNEETGDQALLGETYLNGGVMQARVIEGIYDVFWELVNGGSTVPGNRRAKLFDVGLRSPAAALALDIPMVVLEGDIRLNGVAPSDFHNGQLELGNRLSLDRVVLGDSSDGSYQRRVIPGAFDTVYRHESGTQVPANTHAIVGETCVPQGSESLVTLSRDIDLQSRVISGTISLDGQIPPTSNFESGFIIFHDPFTGDEFIVGETKNGTYSAHVLLGHYEVFYSRELGGAQVPRNSHARIGALTVCHASP